MPSPFLAACAGAIAQAATLALTMPLWVNGNVTRVVRVALALGLMPAILAAHHAWLPLPVAQAAVRGAVVGASLGLSATIVFGAVTSAGSLIDSMLAWSPLPGGTALGSVQHLFQLGCMAVYFASGGAALLIRSATLGDTHLPLLLFSVAGASALARICLGQALVLATPALVAQALAALLAGLLARAAPTMGGVVMSAPAICACVGVALIVSAGSLLRRFLALAALLAHAGTFS